LRAPETRAIFAAPDESTNLVYRPWLRLDTVLRAGRFHPEADHMWRRYTTLEVMACHRLFRPLIHAHSRLWRTIP